MVKKIMSTYDVIIVGGGTGGAPAAYHAAELGLKTLVIDRLPMEQIAVKVCGDATSKYYWDFIKEATNTKLKPPHGDEIEMKVKGTYLYSPGRRMKFTIIDKDGEPWIIDRFKYGKRVLKEALDKGIDFIDNIRVTGPIVENDYVVGVKAKLKNGETKEFRGKVIIDASGIYAVIRTALDPNKTHMDVKLLPKDICNAYREIRDFDASQFHYDDPEYLRIFFDQKIVPGGYIWEFPRSETSVNVGLGVVTIGNYPNTRKQFEYYLNLYENMYKNSKVIHKGGWRIPLRRPMDALVWNGVALIGDAGTCVKPTDGGGIGQSHISGMLAVHYAAQAIENDDVSTKGLWPYARHYMTTSGAKNGPLAIMKDFVITLENDVLTEVMEKKILTEEDFLALNSEAEFSMSIMEKAKRVFRARKMLGFLRDLKKTVDKMEQAKQLYLNYPEQPGKSFLEWKAKIEDLYRPEHPLLLAPPKQKN